MAKLEWEKRTRLEKPRELPWDSRLERQANRILGGLVTPPPKPLGGNRKRVLSARGQKKARVIDEDIWVVFGADCPWNPVLWRKRKTPDIVSGPNIIKCVVIQYGNP